MPKALWYTENPFIRLKRLTRQMDTAQSALFDRHLAPHAHCALYAVGGYGRKELFPCSDVDLLLITDTPEAENLSAWVADLWHLGRSIAPRITTFEQLKHDSQQDITLLTSLLDARLIAHTLPQSALPPLPLFPLSPLDFIEAKWEEQKSRDRRAGKLEPNVKTDVGGLRDLHTMRWLLRYCYPENTPQIFDKKDIIRLKESQNALYALRLLLHDLAPKSHDNLYFAQQLDLAKRFVPHIKAPHQAVELFMQTYYRHTYRIRQFNQRFISLIHHAHLPKRPPQIYDTSPNIHTPPLYLENQHLNSDEDMVQNPKALWSLLQVLQQNPTWHIHPNLSHRIYQNRDLFIQNNNRLTHLSGLKNLLNQAGRIFPQMEWLHSVGLLHRLIPDFWATVGKMQYDLFHAYTVDHHSLLLTHYLDYFHQNDDKRYPNAHQLMQQHQNPAPLYFAALTHDIGKGKAGKHEEIGAELIAHFLNDNPIFTPEEQQHITQLIRCHLLLSITAQKQDLHDDEVIKRFVAHIPNRAFLDDLYLLTLADISATNPQLWNDWKAQLMRELYDKAVHYLNHQALEATIPTTDNPQLKALWQTLPRAFFHAENEMLILQKSQSILDFPKEYQYHVAILSPQRILVLSRKPSLDYFSRITHFLEKHHCEILEARLYNTLDHQLTLHEYTLSSTPNHKALWSYLEKHEIITVKKRHQSLKLRYFNAPIHLNIQHRAQHTLLEFQGQDEHGLLSKISQILLQQNIQVIHAKISTFGERVEDQFTLQNQAKTHLTEAETQALQSALIAAFQR